VMRAATFLYVLILLGVTFAGNKIEDLDLDFDSSSLQAAGEDYGHLVSLEPFAVANPSSVDELETILKTARKNHVVVAAQGQSHSVMGQNMAANGIAINMTNFNQIYIDAQNMNVWVGAGATWRELLEATLQVGLTPKIFTDYIDLSIGGVISAGGIGAQSYRAGFQVDNVLALQVVNGKGKTYDCSPSSNSELFHAVVGGLGQFGVITKVNIPLEPAQSFARYVRTLYVDIDVFLADMFFLLHDERYEGVQGFVVANDEQGLAIGTGNAFPNLNLPIGSSPFLYMIEATAYYTGAAPDIADLQQGLNNIPGEEAINILDLPYYVYIARLDPIEAALRDSGLWYFPHPWIDVFVPRSEASSFIQNELSLLGPTDVNGAILVYPYLTSVLNTPNFPVPDEDEIVTFGLLRTAIPPTPQRAAELVAANEQIYTRTLAVGGTGYSIDAVPLNPEAWEVHFGATRYAELLSTKKKHDPENILAPTQHVFYNHAI